MLENQNKYEIETKLSKDYSPPSPPERTTLSLSVEFHQTFKTYISQILFKLFE